MGIQRPEHAVDRTVDKRIRLYLFNIVIVHQLEHIGEQS